MFVPLFLEQVRIKDRPDVFLVFRINRDKETADLFCPRWGLVERGVRWTMPEAAWRDWGKDDQAS
jgi:hypothetical protein